MNRAIINFVAFQLGWFSCVLGAANGYPLVGPIVVLAALVLHFRLVRYPRREIVLVLLAGMLGAVFDTLLVRTGWLVYPNGILLAGTAPYWIVAMWVLFATTLNLSMRWMHGRPLAAILLGAIGGPLSYLAGERLGGLEFIEPQPALLALGIGWATVTPLLVSLSSRLDGMATPDDVLMQHA